MARASKLKPCRTCGGPKDPTLPRWERGWNCQPCEAKRIEEGQRQRSLCRECSDYWNCLACKRIKRDRMREAALRGVETRRASQAGYFRPADSSRYWQGKAHAMVKSAIKHGLLPDLKGGEYACFDCGSVAHEYDHRDYAQPLAVQPVCRSCNKQRGTAKWPSAETYQFIKIETVVKDAA